MIIDQESAQDSYALTFIVLCFSSIATSIPFCPMSKKNPPRLKAPPLYLGIVQLLGHFVQQFGNCPTTGWFFLTGPPLKMSLDWPPPKMPWQAPPCFGKVLSMAAEKGEIPNTLTFSIPMGGQSGTLMFFWNQLLTGQHLANSRGGQLKKTPCIKKHLELHVPLQRIAWTLG